MINQHVVEQHAEEAGFLWMMRHQAVHAPHYDLADIAELDEALEAHLDGLRVAGQAGWDAVMALALEAPESIFPLSVLAFGGDDRERMRDAFIMGGADAETLSALISALGWLEDATATLAELMGAQIPIYRRAGIAASAIRRQDPGPLLGKLIDDSDAQVRARALRAAGELKRRDLAAQVAAHFNDSDETCRFWALWTLCIFGYPKAVDALYPYLFKADSPFNLHALHMGLRRAPPAQQADWFNALCRAPGLERQAVTGAGIIGNPALMPWLIEQMQQPALAKYAGESFSMMTGVDIYHDDLDLKENDEENDDDESENDPPESAAENDEETPDVDDDDERMPDSNEEDGLPVPDPRSIAAWWKEHHRRYAIGNRYLAGEIISIDAAMNVLRRGMQRQRKAAALELALLQREQPLFEVRARGKKQKGMLGP